MRGRALVRLVMVAVFGAMVLAVSLLWREQPDDVPAGVSEATEVEPGIVSVTRGLEFTAEENGVRRYQLRAGRALTYEGRRQEYDMGVELLLYSVPAYEGGPQDVTRVSAQRMETVGRAVPIEGDPYELVRLHDDVRALLPSGAELSADVLEYRDGELTTQSGVLMRAGGLLVEARNLSYDPDDRVARLGGNHPATQRPQMRGPVKLWSEVVDAADGFAIEGDTHQLVYEVNESRLRLISGPQVLLPQATLTGLEIALALGEKAGAIAGIEASGDARAVWRPEESAREHTASAELIAVELLEGRPAGLVARSESEDALRPAFEVEGGTLRADVIALNLAADDEAAVSATGQAYFFPDSQDAPLEHILAGELLSGAGDVGELLAGNGVEIVLRGTAEGAAAGAAAAPGAKLTGPRARMVYRDDDIVAAEWPNGMGYSDEASGLEVAAGYGERDADSGAWILRAAGPDAPAGATSARPSMRSPEIDVDADVISMLPSGDVDLTGGVGARLSGDVIRTVGALFGDATELQAAADALEVRGNHGRLDFIDNARIWRDDGEQLLRADRISLRSEADELEAQGNVIVSLVEPADPEAGRPEPRPILLSGRSMLVEGEPLRMIVNGDALLVLEGEGRQIGGGRLTVMMSDTGAWQALEVENNAVMTDAAGRGEGARLEYDAITGVVVIHAGETQPAAFVPSQGLDIRDREGLRLEWEGDVLRVTAMQNGTTQTVRRGGGTQR